MCLTRPPPVLSKTVPQLPKEKWATLDAELCIAQANIFHDLAYDNITTENAMNIYGEFLEEFLASKPEFQEEVKDFYKHAAPKTLAEAKKAKNCLRKKAMAKDATDDERTRFKQALKIYNFLLKKEKEKTEAGKIRKQEEMYKKKVLQVCQSSR